MTPARKAYLLGLSQYPQMRLAESLLVREWLRKHADEYDDVDFNMPLGTPLELPTGFDDSTRRMAAISTQQRADIVAWRGTDFTIGEVKVHVDGRAMGQLLSYGTLLRAERPDVRSVRLVGIGQTALLDAPDIFAAHGIDLELFPMVQL